MASSKAGLNYWNRARLALLEFIDRVRVGTSKKPAEAGRTDRRGPAGDIGDERAPSERVLDAQVHRLVAGAALDRVADRVAGAMLVGDLRVDGVELGALGQVVAVTQGQMVRVLVEAGAVVLVDVRRQQRMLAVPLLVGLLCLACGLRERVPALYLGLTLQGVAPPMMAAPAMAALMGLDATLVLASMVASTALVPFTAPLFAHLFLGGQMGRRRVPLGLDVVTDVQPETKKASSKAGPTR